MGDLYIADGGSTTGKTSTLEYLRDHHWISMVPEGSRELWGEPLEGIQPGEWVPKLVNAFFSAYDPSAPAVDKEASRLLSVFWGNYFLATKIKYFDSFQASGSPFGISDKGLPEVALNTPQQLNQAQSFRDFPLRLDGEILKEAMSRQYPRTMFFFEMLPLEYFPDGKWPRPEIPRDKVTGYHEGIRTFYQQQGYRLISVQPGTLEERAEFIVQQLDNLRA